MAGTGVWVKMLMIKVGITWVPILFVYKEGKSLIHNRLIIYAIVLDARFLLNI